MDLLGAYDSSDSDGGGGGADGGGDAVRVGQAAGPPPPPPPLAATHQQVDARGKQRRWAHTEGLRPSVVYLDVPLDARARRVCRAYTAAAAAACGVPASAFVELDRADQGGGGGGGAGGELPAHVSLSRTLLLREVDAPEFLGALRQAVGSEPPFHLSLEGAQVFVNEDASRSFVGLLVAEGEAAVRRLVARVDAVARRFHQPVYYDVRGWEGRGSGWGLRHGGGAAHPHQWTPAPRPRLPLPQPNPPLPRSPPSSTRPWHGRPAT